MCLTTKQLEPEISKEDIICYKLLYKKDGKLYTAYRDYLIQNKELEDVGEGSYSTFEDYKFVDKGFFHAYLSLEDTKFYKNYHRGLCRYLTTIYKVVIPKGSKYYTGCKGDICSNKMIIQEEYFD